MKGKIKLLFIFVLSISLQIPANAGINYDYYVNMQNDIFVGSVLQISLDIQAEEGYAFEIIHDGLLKSDDYVFIREGQVISLNDQKYNKTFYIIPSRDGKIYVDPVKIEYWSDEWPEKRNFVLTGNIPVNVVSNILEGGLVPRDIKGPFDLAASYLYLLLFLLVLLLLSVLTAVLHFRKKKTKEEQKTAVPAEYTAKNRLNELIEKGYLEQGKLKLFLFELTFIIKEYISNAYLLNSVEMTVSELENALRAQDIDRAIFTEIMDFFRACDIYKFSDTVFEKTRARELYDIGSDFVDRDSFARKARMVYERSEDGEQYV